MTTIPYLPPEMINELLTYCAQLPWYHIAMCLQVSKAWRQLLLRTLVYPRYSAYSAHRQPYRVHKLLRSRLFRRQCINKAIVDGQLNIIKYLVKYDWPLHDTTIETALFHGRERIVSWIAYNYGHPKLSQQFIYDIVVRGQAHALNLCIDISPDSFDACENMTAAIESLIMMCNIPRLELLRDRDLLHISDTTLARMNRLVGCTTIIQWLHDNGYISSEFIEEYIGNGRLTAYRSITCS